MALFSVQTPFGGSSNWDPLTSFGESYMDYAFGSAAADDAQERQRQNALLQYELSMRSLREAPAAAREGLIAAGYNPLLAVNSGAGAGFSNSIPGGPMAALHGSTSQGGSVSVGSLLGRQMEKISAETDFIKRRTLGEGWQIKTLSRSEAQGLGANLVHTLGFNFHDSSQQTFLVAYNPITGELRNLGDTSSGLGSTAPASNAADVKAIPVDWNTDKSPRYKFNPDDWELKTEYRK